MDYILEPLDTDPESILQDYVDYIQNFFPDWRPSEGQLDYMLARFFALKIAVTADMASRVARSIFRYFGNTVVGIPPFDATFAQGSATFPIIDSSVSHTLAADTLLAITDSNGDIQMFSVDSDVSHAIGATSITANYTAVESGSPANALTGTVQLIEGADWLNNGTTVAPTAGGEDAEDDETYLNRLTSNFSLMAPRPILGPDFALISQNIPGVWRASAIDNYLPGPPPVTNAAMAVAVCAIDNNGNAVSAQTKSDLDAYLQSMRQQNFIVNVLDPQYSTIDVTYTAVKVPGADPEDARTQANNALKSYLSPNVWGASNYPTEIRAWYNQPVVRYLELTTVVENVAAIDHLTNLTFSITSGGAQDKNDKTMPGTFPLPRYGTINGNSGCVT